MGGRIIGGALWELTVSNIFIPFHLHSFTVMKNRKSVFSQLEKVNGVVEDSSPYNNLNDNILGDNQVVLISCWLKRENRKRKVRKKAKTHAIKSHGEFFKRRNGNRLTTRSPVNLKMSGDENKSSEKKSTRLPERNKKY